MRDAAGAESTQAVSLTVDDPAITALTALPAFGYATDDVITHLFPPSAAPNLSTVAADLLAADIDPLDPLLALYGPSAGANNQDLALAEALNTLGVSEAQAVGILESFGYTTPQQIGTILWNDGYGLGYVAQGIYDALPAASSRSGWISAVLLVLVKMPDCGSGDHLGALPVCSTGTPFTASDQEQALASALGQSSLSCSDAEICALVWQALQTTGASASDIVATMTAAPYSMPLSQVAANLQSLAGYTAARVVSAESSAPVSASAAQIADSLYATTFSPPTVGDALVSAAGSQEAASIDMKNAGYSAPAIGSWYATLPGASLEKVFLDLQDIGFDFSDAEAAAYQLYPIDPSQFMSVIGSTGL